MLWSDICPGAERQCQLNGVQREREREEMLQISYLLTQILRHYYQILDTHKPDISNLICIYPQDRELQELRKTIENLRKQGARMYLGWISHFP